MDLAQEKTAEFYSDRSMKLGLTRGKYTQVTECNFYF